MSKVGELIPEEFTNEDWLRIAYLCLLQRHADEVGYNDWMDKIRQGTFNYKTMIDTLISSPEFIMHYQTPFHMMVHQSRQRWIKEIGYYRSILDIGGSSANTELGALMELGYGHKPESIVIFDLPPEQQYWGKPTFDQSRPYSFSWGKIEYIHGRAEKIPDDRRLDGRSFDCIFMGQTIEHIDPEALPALLRWIKSHLAPGGRYIMDTPNRLVTRIQSPDGFIDNDHKYEYTPAELENILTLNGFKVVNRWGLMDLPGSCSSKAFDPLESYKTELLVKSPETSYCFAFECAVKDN